MNEDCSNWSNEKLRRKADQHWEMVGLARQDRDATDEKRHTDEARQLEAVLMERIIFDLHQHG